MSRWNLHQLVGTKTFHRPIIQLARGKGNGRIVVATSIFKKSHKAQEQTILIPLNKGSTPLTVSPYPDRQANRPGKPGLAVLYICRSCIHLMLYAYQIQTVSRSVIANQMLRFFCTTTPRLGVEISKFPVKVLRAVIIRIKYLILSARQFLRVVLWFRCENLLHHNVDQIKISCREGFPSLENGAKTFFFPTEF